MRTKVPFTGLSDVELAEIFGESAFDSQDNADDEEHLDVEEQLKQFDRELQLKERNVV